MKTDREKIEKIKELIQMTGVSPEAKLLGIMIIVGNLNK